MIQIQRALATAAIATTFVIGACKGDGSTDDVTSNKSMAVMSTYAEYYNEMIKTVPDMIKNYMSRVGDGEKIGEKEFKMMGLACMGSPLDVAKVKASLEKAKKESTGEFKDLPPLAEAMFEAGKSISETRAELCKNVKAEDYKDDGGAKANELHKKLVALVPQWSKATGEMSAALDKFEDQQALSQIKKYEGDKDDSYWFRFFNLKAKSMIRAVETGPDRVAPAADELLKASEELDAFAKGKGDKLNAAFKAYVDRAEDFATDTKKLRRDVGAEEDAAKKAKLVDKARNGFISDYNTLISLSDSLMSLEASKVLK